LGMTTTTEPDGFDVSDADLAECARVVEMLANRLRGFWDALHEHQLLNRELQNDLEFSEETWQILEKLLERQKQKLLEQLASGPSKTELESARNTQKAQNDKILYGVDVCFLMDCTGSMSAFIKAAKEKVYEIIREITKNENKATLRFAFVGYRDHCDGADRLVSVDFVDEIKGSAFESTLNACPATGGGDAPEDVAGGLNLCTQLSWLCSTRLLIHFGDAPCHGSNYHACQDSYPGGDPLGLKPEDLLQTLINKRVDYYFMRINTSTDKMASIFQNVYERVREKFTIIPVDAAAADFAPKVVNSIRSSMARSVAFKRG